MTANLTRPRPDLVFLRRRLRKGEAAPAAQEATAASPSLSLKLNRAAEDEPTFAPSPVEEVGPAIPAVVGVHRLKDENDACRFNPRQSAIGSLVIENARVAAWQLNDGTSGFIYPHGETETEEPGTTPAEFLKRPLVQFHEGKLVVGLRHIRNLKRLIIVPKNGETMKAETVGGTGVIMDYEPFTVLYISLIDRVLEFRKEDFQRTIVETFSFATVKP